MKILVIPHVLSHPVRVRGNELADALAARGHRVTLLTARSQEPGLGTAGKLAFHARNLLPSVSRSRRGARILALPGLAFRGRTPGLLNRGAAQCLADRGGFDAVINGSCDPVHELIPPRGARYVLDIVDDHVEGARLYESPARAREIEAFYAAQLRLATGVAAVSGPLAGAIRARWGAEARVIPNGVDLAELRSPDAARVERLRRELGLQGCFVFGYIGGVDEYVDVACVNAAFERARARHPRARLLWIGPGRHSRMEASEREALRARGILCLGAIPVEQVPAHLALLDAGLIPKIPNAFTHAMMPIKSLEYGAARLPVIASPLAELARLAFPNVVLRALEADAWAEAMERLLEPDAPRWDAAWDRVYDGYGWDDAARRFEEAFLAHPAR